MKKLARLFAIITMVVIITLMSVNSVSFGYFFTTDKTIKEGGKAEFTEKNSDASVRKVSTAEELYLAVKDVNFNNENQISIAQNRFTILLGGNITLSGNLVITADCNIDLGGFSLNLSGYNLTFSHTYHGALQVYNGNITGDIGATLIVNTPNAIVDFSLAAISENVVLDVVNVSVDEIFLQAFQMVDGKLFGSQASVSLNNRECLRHAEKHHLCAYVCQDVDLPLNLYGYEVGFEYFSDNTSAITADGKVNSAVGVIADANFIVNLSYAGQTKTKNYSLHIYSPQDSETMQQVALISAANSLEKYYFEGQLEGGEEIVSLYKLYQSTYLPRYIGGVELDYTTLTNSGQERDSTLNISGNNFELIGVSGYAVNLDEHVTHLRISTKTGKSLIITVNGSDVSSVVDNYTIALKIAAELYGEEIIIKEENGYNGYTKIAITDDMTKYASKGVVGVEYLMSYDIDKTYRIGELAGQSGRYMYVANANNKPTILQKAGLRLRFSFDSEPTMVSLTIPIRFVQDDQTEGNMLAKFWPYYNYFDRLFTAKSGKYGINTFTMPFNYEDKVVYYYEVLRDGAPSDVITSTLYYYVGKESRNATLAEVKAMTAAQISEIVATNKANWTISFNIDKLSINDIDLQFKYMYKFNDFKTTWYGQETDDYISNHTAAGIIKDKVVIGAEDYIADANLYAYVYNNSKPSNIASYAANSGKYIHTVWLNDDFAEISNVNNVLNIKNYDGLQLLKNVRKLNLNGAIKGSAIKQEITAYIAGMTSLVELDLSNNSTNFSDRGIGILNLPSGNNNGAIRRLSTLTKLEKLHLEGNYIYYYNDLKYIPNLKEVCVYNNVITITLLNISTLFGTNGVVNYSIFNSLTGKGVKVNNVSEGSGYKGGSDSNKVVDAISSLVYQKIIPKNASVTQAYSGLSTSWTDYLKEKMTKPTGSWWGATKDGEDQLKFTYDGLENETNSFRLEYKYFYYVAKFFSFDEYEIVIDFEFDVIRV